MNEIQLLITTAFGIYLFERSWFAFRKGWWDLGLLNVAFGLCVLVLAYLPYLLGT